MIIYEKRGRASARFGIQRRGIRLRGGHDKARKRSDPHPKEERGALSVTIKGGGIGGTICVSGDKALHMRGYIENPHAQLPPNAQGKLDVGGCVGKDGYISVVRDDGDNVPFVGTTELVSGEIGEDFAAYFAYSEQIPTAVAVGVKIGTDGTCLGAGGVFLQPLPGASEESIRKAEEIIGRFSAVSSLMEKMTAQEVLEQYFGAVKFYTEKPEYKSQEVEELIVRMRGDT